MPSALRRSSARRGIGPREEQTTCGHALGCPCARVEINLYYKRLTGYSHFAESARIPTLSVGKCTRSLDVSPSESQRQGGERPKHSCKQNQPSPARQQLLERCVPQPRPPQRRERMGGGEGIGDPTEGRRQQLHRVEDSAEKVSRGVERIGERVRPFENQHHGGRK